MTLAYDPINNLKSKLLKGEDVVTFKPASIKVPTVVNKIFINSLLKDNFKLQKNETDSELSEWTDSDEEVESDSTDKSTVKEKQVSSKKQLLDVASLKPPEKPKVYQTVLFENSDVWLRKNVQNSWWTNELTSVEISSSHPTANFYNYWQKHLSDKSLGFIKPAPVSLISEYCLLREIFWMFSNPVDCKFFKIEKDEISLRSNVTLPSVMPESLKIFLSDFVGSINLMNRLKKDCLKSYQSSALSHTMESYFKIIQINLDEIMDFILEKEESVKTRKTNYSTLIELHNEFRSHAKMLKMLWNIHETSTLDATQYAPHICASYLLASLNHHVQISCTKEKKNLAITFLITCLKSYLEIFEIWWTQARLDDLKHEFLMEKCDSEGFESIQPRLLEKSKDKSFFLNDAISKKITEDSIIGAMLNYSVKASSSLDIINKLDRVHEMRQIVNDSTPLYDEFMNRINDEIFKFAQKRINAEPENSNLGSGNEKVLKNHQLVEDIRNGMLADGDELLLLAFKSTFERLVENTQLTDKDPSPLYLYNVLNNATKFTLLPLEYSIRRTIIDLLSNKIAIAERFVMNIYIHEFYVQQNLQEMRKVFFLESNELADFFYLKLFPQMEAGEAIWANPYLLTVALNDAISSSRQNSSTLFRVEVNRGFHYNSVLKSVDGLTLYFNVHRNLINIFSLESIQKYNEGIFLTRV